MDVLVSEPTKVKGMEDVTILVIVGILAFTTLEALALYFGIDSQLFATVISTISSLITGFMAYYYGKRKGREELERKT